MIKKKKKINETELLISLLNKAPLNKDAFLQIAAKIDELSDVDISQVENWCALGLELCEQNGVISLATNKRELCKQEFCVVDIETTGSINSGQIIEIGAIKLINGEQTGAFSTLIYADCVPQVITELTGLSANDLMGAPSLAYALKNFRDFLGDCVFVAHNVRFDYGFISKSLVDLGYPPLLNRALCTVELAKRCIASQRYKLNILKELLGIENIHHRAFSDAISAAEILKYCILKLPWSVQSVEDLIFFSKSAPSMQIEPKIEPLNQINFN